MSDSTDASMPKASFIQRMGTFSTRNEAASILRLAGQVALVKRGAPRMLLMRCPCGCGDDLVINLDQRAGPAWRMYQKGDYFSLFPSYWRDSKCGSHFIIWKNRIYWCDWEDEEVWSRPADIEDKVLEVLSEHFTSYIDIAESLQEIPWDVLQACNSLVKKGLARANGPRRKFEFKRVK